MPQFDQYIFLSQMFWLVVFFLAFYLVITYFFLPAMASLLKVRTLRKNKKNEEALSYLTQLADSTSSYLNFFSEFNLYNNGQITEISNKSVAWSKVESKPKHVYLKVCQNLSTVLGKEFILYKVSG
jgi:hypothetical protein